MTCATGAGDLRFEDGRIGRVEHHSPRAASWSVVPARHHDRNARTVDDLQRHRLRESANGAHHRETQLPCEPSRQIATRDGGRRIPSHSNASKSATLERRVPNVPRRSTSRGMATRPRRRISHGHRRTTRIASLSPTSPRSTRRTVDPTSRVIDGVAPQALGASPRRAVTWRSDAAIRTSRCYAGGLKAWTEAGLPTCEHDYSTASEPETEGTRQN